MNDTPKDPVPENDGWEWMIIEIMGHRRHAGRAREEERFGTKMLRIDVPCFGGSPALNAERPEGPQLPSRWETRFYGGASIFSISLTDEETVMKMNHPYAPPARITMRPWPSDDEHASSVAEDIDGADQFEAEGKGIY
jgi:hypothetical protein